MRIGDLVQADLQGEFRSDVKLSDYDDPALNADLLKHYIFTVHEPATPATQQRMLSAWGVLRRLRDMFVTDRVENRMLLIANYGHGKSHLALVLANLFSKEPYSDEVGVILDRLHQALNDPSQLRGYRDFKQAKGEFLVARLRGDAFSDLHAAFTAALEQALAEHEATRDVQMPFWQANARAWLKGLQGEMRDRAEAFLAERHTDLTWLIRSLGGPGSYDLVRALSRHLLGAPLDFGREVSLEEVVRWAVNEVCKPRELGGLLVLFDEFGLFLQKYAGAGAPGKLQELLNGISACRGRAALVAFSQLDVNVIATAYALDSTRRQGIEKELERLPADERHRLHSAMESVLAAYLKQNQKAWEAFETKGRVKGSLVSAREVTLRYFSRRYEDDLRWQPDHVLDRLVKGCFPLHPLTTAILATHNFEAGSSESPRTALQFVRRVWEDAKDQPALSKDGLPHFVHPVGLVDFFGDAVSKEWHAAYCRAAEAVTPDSNEDRVLKALLLQQAVYQLLRARGGEQIDLLAHLSGIAQSEVKQALKDLAQRDVIQHDALERRFALWSATVGPVDVRAVIEQVESAIAVDEALMRRIREELSVPELASLGFGSSSDWRPEGVVLTTELFTSDVLKSHLSAFAVEQDSLREGIRGLLVCVVAEDETRRAALSQNAQAIVDQALNDAPQLPVVVLLPRRATPQVVQAARRLRALEQLSNTDRDKIGEQHYARLRQDAELRLKQAVQHWLDVPANTADAIGSVPREPQDFLVPQRYRPYVQALSRPSLKVVLEECYKRAYAARPKFFTQYQVTGRGPNRLRDAAHKVALAMLTNNAAACAQGRSRDVEFQLCTDYLRDKWGLLDAQYRIQPPTDRVIQAAWDALERAFPEGCREVRAQQVILELLNPPYGYDYNLLTLLLAAWIGYYKDTLHLFVQGRRYTVTDFRDWFDTTQRPQDFISQCVSAPLAISRVKRSEAQSSLERMLQRTRFTIREAREVLAEAEGARALFPEAKQMDIEKRCGEIREALQVAERYDSAVADWSKALEASDLEEVVRARRQIENLPQCALVLPNSPPVSELVAKWQQAIQARLPGFCAQQAALLDIEGYEAQKRRLDAVRRGLSQFPPFVEQLDEAMQKLAQARDELQKQRQEREIVAQIQQVSPTDVLSKLYAHRELLRPYANLSAQTAQLRDQKLKEVEAEIQRIEREVAHLVQNADRILSLPALRQAQQKLAALLTRVGGTPYKDQLTDLQGRYTRLDEFLSELDQLRRQQPDTPEDIAAQRDAIRRLDETAPDWLGAAQRELIEDARQRLEQIRRQKEQKAMSWLADQERKADDARHGEALSALRRALESPPPFLPTDQGTRLEQLRQRVQQRLDEDVVAHIEALFSEIADPERRRQCVARLQALLETR